MNYEKSVKNITSYSVSVTNNAVTSLRVSEDLKTSVRVYEDGKIGVAGAIGECSESSLLEEAKQKLNQGIPYPYCPAPAIRRSERGSDEIISYNDFVPACKSLVKRLSESFPDFIFSNKINEEKYWQSYSSSSGAALNYKSNNITIALTIKAKDSANIMDLMYSAVQNRYGEDEIIADAGALLGVYKNRLQIPEGIPVLIPADIVEFLVPHLVAEKYMAGSGIFNGRLGQKIFDGKVSISLSRKSDNKENLPFFDCEGTVLKGDEYPLINGGVLSGLLTCKRSASRYNLPLSGGAEADFDGVPSYGTDGVRILPTSNSLKNLVRGKAIYIAVTSGGDMTTSGEVGLPVLLAYVYEDGKLLGTLPEFSLSGNIFDMLGRDFIGAAKNDAFSFADETLIVTRMKINA